MFTNSNITALAKSLESFSEKNFQALAGMNAQLYLLRDFSSLYAS